MPTMLDQLKAQQEKMQAALAAHRQLLAAAEQKVHAEERRLRTKRQAAVGKLVDTAGLLDWPDATLLALFTALAQRGIDAPPPPVPQPLRSEPITRVPASSDAAAD